eukprot:TRINITY_DN4039_c0_g4_i5.p1 TRINITY_DN4039_c0_g4~~TRINITY_DN4039_c0_g4_i5.p1  ORF type:complete len:140 (-),score=11.86 TRINITY_DN4039_c0_g4_i5:45-464(-)
MGKEVIRNVPNGNGMIFPHSYTNASDLQMEFDNQWASQKQVVFKHQVIESGNVVVYVQQQQERIKLLFTGMKKHGNSYKALFARLQLSGVISVISRVKLFQKLAGTKWEIVNPNKDTFQTNDIIPVSYTHLTLPTNREV